MLSGRAFPGTGSGGLPGEIGKVAGRATKRAHHAVCGVGVAPIQRFARNGSKDVGDEAAARLCNICVKFLEADREMPDIAAGGLRQLDVRVPCRTVFCNDFKNSFYYFLF